MLLDVPSENPVEIAEIQKPAMADPDDAFIHSEAFLSGLMKRQLRLSIVCALAFLALLTGLPLLNYLAPELMARRIGGFTLSWLVLGVLFFPYVWVIAAVFIRRSIALENAETQLARSEPDFKPAPRKL